MMTTQDIARTRATEQRVTIARNAVSEDDMLVYSTRIEPRDAVLLDWVAGKLGITRSELLREVVLAWLRDQLDGAVLPA